MGNEKIKFKLNGYIYDGEIEDRNHSNGTRILVKRFLVSGGYDYQLIHSHSLIG